MHSELSIQDPEIMFQLISDKVSTLSNFYMKDWTLRLEDDELSLEIKYFFTRTRDRNTKWKKLVQEILKIGKLLFDHKIEIEFSLGGDDQGDYLRLFLKNG